MKYYNVGRMLSLSGGGIKLKARVIRKDFANKKRFCGSPNMPIQSAYHGMAERTFEPMNLENAVIIANFAYLNGIEV